VLGPRLVVAGTHSGVGKTTVATGLMAALTARGLRVGAAKVGPDFIDPGYHTLATGRPARNLDAWMCGEDAVGALAVKAAAGCDVLVVEGVMGLFDGAGERDLVSAHAGAGAFASTAHVARLLRAPVVLVVDAGAMSGSVAALVHGFATFDPAVALAGVVLNRVGSDAHEAMLREALAPLGVPVMGVLRRDDALTWRDRHLGLVPVVEDTAAVMTALARLAAVVARDCDLEAIEALSRSARALACRPLPGPDRIDGPSVPIAVAGGQAFSFMYIDNLEALEAAGAQLVPVDPLHDRALPVGVRGLVVGGGFPEVHVERLAANASLLADVRRRISAGLVTWAECGGLLWLSRSLDGRPMAGALACTATMTERLTLGYRRATITAASPLGPPGTALRGHEFHYSSVDPPGGALSLSGRGPLAPAGFATPTLVASYLHVHAATSPAVVSSFVRAAASHGRSDLPRRSDLPTANVEGDQ